MGFMVAHPLATAAVVTIASLGAAAWILRFEARAQLRAHRYGGYLIGGDR